MKKLVLLSFMFISFFTEAVGTINCGTVTIDSVYVQGDRQDGGLHANIMLILLGSDKKDECSDITYAYLENDDDAYSGTLSMAIAAYMAGKKLRVQVEGTSAMNGAKRIAWVNF